MQITITLHFQSGTITFATLTSLLPTLDHPSIFHGSLDGQRKLLKALLQSTCCMVLYWYNQVCTCTYQVHTSMYPVHTCQCMCIVHTCTYLVEKGAYAPGYMSRVVSRVLSTSANRGLLRIDFLSTISTI